MEGFEAEETKPWANPKIKRATASAWKAVIE